VGGIGGTGWAGPDFNPAWNGPDGGTGGVGAAGSNENGPSDGTGQAVGGGKSAKKSAEKSAALVKKPAVPPKAAQAERTGKEQRVGTGFWTVQQWLKHG